MELREMTWKVRVCETEKGQGRAEGGYWRVDEQVETDEADEKVIGMAKPEATDKMRRFMILSEALVKNYSGSNKIMKDKSLREIDQNLKRLKIESQTWVLEQVHARTSYLKSTVLRVVSVSIREGDLLIMSENRKEEKSSWINVNKLINH